MTDPNQVGRDLAKIFTDPNEFIGVCSGSVESDGTVNVARPDGTTVNAVLANAGRGSNTLCQRINGTWYAWREGESNVEIERIVSERRSRPDLTENPNYYKELLDVNQALKGKTFKIGKKSIKITSKTFYPIKVKADKNFDDLKETSDQSLVENKNYFAVYSDTTYLNSFQYIKRIGDSDKILAQKDQVTKTLIRKDKFTVTNCTPFRLYSFISNKNTNPATNLSQFFTSPLTQLKRNNKKYNKNCYYAWLLREVGDVTYIYGYGWVNPEGKLIPTKINFEQDPGCYLSNDFVFHSANNYDGHMVIDIGCFDRTKKIAYETINGVTVYIYIPLILLPEPDPYSFYMYAPSDSQFFADSQISSISELSGIYYGTDNGVAVDWGNGYNSDVASLFNAINSTILYVPPSN